MNAVLAIFRPQILVYIEQSKLGNFLSISDQQYLEFHFSNFECCKSPGKKHFSFSHQGFEIQKDYDSETSEFKLHSFRAFRQHLTDKDRTDNQGTASVLQFS